MKLWLDDERPAPIGFVWAKTAQDAYEIMRYCAVDEAHLDHDLGADIDGEDHPNNGSWLCNTLEEDAYLDRLGPVLLTARIVIHSHNPDGVKQMVAALSRAFTNVTVCKYKEPNKL